MSDAQEKIVRKLLESYARHGVINHVDGLNLPTREAVADIGQHLLRLLFPGFFENRVVHSSEIGAITRELLTAACQALLEEVRRSLEFGAQQNYANVPRPSEANSIVDAFLLALADVRGLLMEDVVAAYRGDPAASSVEEVVLAYPCVEAIAIQRAAHVLHGLGVPLLPRMLTEWAHSRTGIDLHPGAKIGGGFFIDHGTGVVVGETCVIGRNVKLYQGVTLGAKSFRRGEDGILIKGIQRHPRIEDDVTIYAGATILGGDTVVGARSVIGGNVWLVESVPPDSVVLMEGGRTIVQSRARPVVDDFQI